MSILDGFQLLRSRRSKPFFTLRTLSITFSKSAVECLDYVEYVHMYEDPENKRVAFQACDRDDETAFIFYQKPKPGRNMLVRISSREYASRLMKMAGLSECRNGVRFYGEYIEEERLIIFDMTKPVFQSSENKES